MQIIVLCAYLTFCDEGQTLAEDCGNHAKPTECLGGPWK